jgi:cytochrome b561
LPITGWLMSSAGGFPVSFFGLFYLPDFIPYDDYLFQRLIAIHKWLGYALILLIVIHTGAALRHHFVFRDDTLRKMLPPTRSGPTALRPLLHERTPQLPSEPWP